MSGKTCVRLVLVILAMFGMKFSEGKKKSLDNYLDLCRRNDPDLSLCVKKTIIKATPQMLIGMPEIGFPPLDPFYIKTLKMVEGGGSFQLSVIMSNVTMKGLQSMSLQKFSINLKNESNIIAKLETKQPWMHFKGKYNMDGRILVVPVLGNGDFYMNFTSPYLKGVLKCHTEINPKDNKKYIVADSFKWDISIKGGKSHFYNLFNGDKVLGNTVNRFMQDNVLDVFAAIKHLPEQAFGKIYKDLVNVFFENYSYDELFQPE